MSRYLYRIVVLLALLLVIPSLCLSWSGRVPHVADGNSVTVERDGKSVKTFTSSASEHKIYSDPRLYVLERLKSSDIVFLGMTHRRPLLLEFVRDLVPRLHKVEVTHIGLEIPSDQQANIDRFLNTGKSLGQIELHDQIECPEYRNILRVIRRLDQEIRPKVVALDLPGLVLTSPV
jgi:hypothetical protein